MYIVGGTDIVSEVFKKRYLSFFCFVIQVFCATWVINRGGGGADVAKK